MAGRSGHRRTGVSQLPAAELGSRSRLRRPGALVQSNVAASAVAARAFDGPSLLAEEHRQILGWGPEWATDLGDPKTSSAAEIGADSSWETFTGTGDHCRQALS